MYDYHYLMVEDRSLREQELSERRAIANAGRIKPGPPLRSRLARNLFSLAFAADEGEAWRAVWERMMGVEEIRKSIKTRTSPAWYAREEGMMDGIKEGEGGKS